MDTEAPTLLVFFDGACPICSREIRFARSRDRLNHIAWIDIAGPTFNAASFGLDAKLLNEALHVRSPDGAIFIGVDAVIQIMRTLPKSFLTSAFLRLIKIPGVKPLAWIYYRWFARNRYRLTGRCTPESCSVPAAPQNPLR